MHVDEHCKGPRRPKAGSLWMCGCGKVYVGVHYMSLKYWDFAGYLTNEPQTKERVNLYPDPPEPTAKPSHV